MLCRCIANGRIKFNNKKIIPYKMIYWRGINIGDWRFYKEIANIKSTILFQSMACGTKSPI